MNNADNDRIEKQIELKASMSKVWKALTDHEQFGAWFRVKLDGPFVAGKPASGHITYPGYEHYKWNAMVQKIDPETYFSFTWHPYAVDLKKDYSKETPTLVEFTLKRTDQGTLLTVVESGFSKIPAERRDEAFRMNSGGWAEQMKNIEAFLGEK